MKPLMSRKVDSGTLQQLGLASVQIVHDLKNQLNGLKLYATFLRKRLEKADRPEDELETMNKLIGGIDRAANDLSTIVQYGHEIELKKQPGCDLQKLLRGISADLPELTFLEAEGNGFTIDCDPVRLSDALRWISIGVAKQKHTLDPDATIAVSSKRKATPEGSVAEVEWKSSGTWDHDPFRSFVGSDEIRMSLASKIVAAHGGTAVQNESSLVVILPISG